MNAVLKQFTSLQGWKKLLSLIVLAGLIVLFGFLSYRVSPLYVLGGLGSAIIALVVFQNPWHGILLLTFFIPFERIGSTDIAGTTIRPSQITALLTMVSFFFLGLGRKRFGIPKNPTVYPLAAFILIALVGLLNAPNLGRSVTVLAFTLFTLALGVFIPFMVKKKKHVEQMLNFFFASMLLVTLFGLYQFAGDLIGLPPELTGLRELYTKDILGFPRVQSTALEPLYFANYLLVPLSILLSFFFARTKSIHPLVTVGLFGLGIINLVLTVARGGYIAFAVSAGILIIYYFFQLKLVTWRNFGYAVISLIIGVIILFKAVGIEAVTNNFASHVGNLFEGASFSERVEMYEIAYKAWLDHPWVGIGPGSFGPYASWHPYVVPQHGWSIVNNEYLELLAENGILGLIAMSLVFVIVIIRSIKAIMIAKDPYLQAVTVGVLAGFLGILVQYNTFSILYIVHIWFVVGLLVALQNIIFKDHQS